MNNRLAGQLELMARGNLALDEKELLNAAARELRVHSESRLLNPAILPSLPGQKALTVTMRKSDDDVQADAAIDAVKKGTSTFLLHDVSDLFFDQIRLRVALDPSLADKIAVYYLQPETRQWEIVEFARKEDEIHWPVGFMNDLWEKETHIIAARSDGDPKAVDRAREIVTMLRSKYGC